MPAALPLTQFQPRAGILDLGWGHPSAGTLPGRAWADATADTLDAYGWRALSYGSGAGPGPLIEWLADHLRDTDALAPTVDQFFVTAGASHALHLLIGLLSRAGDTVIVDRPTYHLALRILADRGVHAVAAPVDEHGIDPDATADLLVRLRGEGRRVPLLYLVPTYANPTGRSLPGPRRHALVELAARIGVTIVEDDTYRELGYDAPAPPSLFSLGEVGTVARVGSFAKTVAPGLRLGWINAARPLIHALCDLGYVDSGGGVNHTTALTMATFGASGSYAAHLATIRSVYAAQRNVLTTAVRPQWTDIEVPAGGWFLWLRLPPPLRAATLLPVAEQHGVSFLPGPVFCVDGTGQDHIRLSFSQLSPADLGTAAARLATALDAAGPPRL